MLDKEHRKEYQRNYRRDHQQELWQRHGKTWGITRARKRYELRKETFEHYGLACACCGESELGFLTIDHINGGGNTHRREVGYNGGTHFYAWLKRNGWPEGFRTLCYNCNCAEGYLGMCPHRRLREQDVF